ncbi:MAG: hypothetical protein ACXWNC_03275 [Anaerolineales bacterium]
MPKRPIWTVISEWSTQLVEAFFTRASDRVSRWVDPLWSAALYLVGIIHWCLFLNWGNVPFDLHDWTETGAYFSFLRQAFLTNQLPLHIGSTLVPTTRYLAQPETLISPQAYLLRFLEPGLFTLVNFLILYSVGYIGLLLLRKRYSLAPAAFSVLFVLFNFNGHITAHYAVGHREWTAYFFLPFFVFLLLKVLEGGKPDWKWVLLSSLTLFGITLQGGFHFQLWCMIFLLAWGLFSPKYLLPAIKVCIFSGLLSLFHLLPAAVEYIGGGKAFISGFPTVADLFAGMVMLKYPADALSGQFSSLGWWELDTYIGLLGLVFLAFFGVYQTWRKGSATKTLLAPIAVVTFLSIGQVYSVVNHLPIPLTDSERISSRFFIVPLVVLIILGSIHLQELLDRLGRRGFVERIASLGLLVLLANDLFQHSRFWRVTNMYKLFQSTPVDIQSKVINHPDPVYFTALEIGAAVTLLTFFALLFLSFHERRPKRIEN